MEQNVIHTLSKTAYWNTKLKEANKTTPFEKNLKGVALQERMTAARLVPQELMNELLNMTKGKEINLFKLLIATMSIVLSKYTVYRELLITTSTFASTTNDGISRLLALAISLDTEGTVRQLLGGIHKELLTTMEQQNYDIAEVTEEVFAVEEQAKKLKSIACYVPGANIWTSELETVDCLVKFSRAAEDCFLELNYQPAVFSASEMDVFAKHLIAALELVVKDLDVAIDELNFTTATDTQIINDAITRAKVSFEEIPVITQFENQVLQTPEAIAVKSGTTSLTYEELNYKANQLAMQLMKCNDFAIGAHVALMVDRSEHIMIGALAVLKAGGVFVPIDIAAPKERVQYCLADSDCSIVLTEAWYLKSEGTVNGKTYLSMDDISGDGSQNPARQRAIDEVIYMIYTSGTTGKPKGTLIYNRSLTNNVNWFKRQYELTPADSTMLINSYNFDGCYGHVWATLVTGGVLHIPKETIFDPEQTLRYIEQEGITHIKIVPSTFGVLVNSPAFTANPTACKSLRLLKQGGEAINVKNLEKYFEYYPTVTLGNHYGPTECTIGSVAYWMTKATFPEFKKQPVLGRLYDNQEIYILNEKREVQPVGVLGEICIGGAGVSKGYYKQPDLTAEKFIEHPVKNQERIYCTGDQGRWLPNGTLEFVGRLDNQVKIRGYRVELDEIAAVAKEHPQISDAICLLYNKGEERYLSLWFVSEVALTKTDMQAYFTERLPEYMRPHFYVREKTMPLTPNGKVDKRGLSDPAEAQLVTENAVVLPTSDEEKRLVALWEALLKVKRVSTTDNFFEIGGHSLKATQLMASIRRELQVIISLKDIFQHPVLADLALLVASKKATGFDEIPTVSPRPYYELSHAQKRMWILNKVTEAAADYNIPHVLQLRGTVDRKLIEQSIQTLVDRHEILRTVFVTQNNEPVQQVLDTYRFELQYESLEELSDNAEAVDAVVQRQANLVFDLSERPPFEALLLKINEGTYLFLLTLHHIISDGWSTEVFGNELFRCYAALNNNQVPNLPPLAIQYKDFAHWQNAELAESKSTKLKAYWQQKFAGELTRLELPYDVSASECSGNRTEKHEVSPALYQQLKEYAKEKETSVFVILLTGLKVLLSRYTGQEDVVIGTPTAGREHSDLTQQIGFYVNTLALRSRIAHTSSFAAIVEEVKQTVWEAHEHQAYPFDLLVQDLQLVTEPGKTPLFNVFASVQNTTAQDSETPEALGFTYANYERDFEHSKFELLINFNESEDALTVELDYQAQLFEAGKMQNLVRHLVELLRNGIEKEVLTVGKMSYMNADETALLQRFSGSVTTHFPWKSLVVEFEKQVQQQPNALALKDDSTSYTYKELAASANRIANYLRDAQGVTPGEIVGILCDRNADYIIAMLAIVKAGAAYLPMERKFTAAHISNVLNISSARVVLTDVDAEPLLAKEALEQVNISMPQLFQKTSSLPPSLPADQLEDLAYVMFTSGTTGKPKGVMVNHQNILRLVKGINYSSLTAEDRFLQTGSLSFDAATFEIWGAFLNGGQLHIIAQQDLLDVKNLHREKESRGITKMWITTAWFHQLADIDVSIFKGLNEIWVGGERLSPEHFERVKTAHPTVPIINFYGPTENTTFSTCGEIFLTDMKNIPIGIPIDNSTVHILDANQQPVPVGVTGEIYLGGLGVSQGYLNNPEETEKRFVQLPKVAEGSLYRSGDLGRWRADGNISFFGRKDHQVKIRGHRIELDGIVAVLQKHPATKEVEVVALDLQGADKVLVAYYTADSNISEETLRSFLANELAAYMVPSYYVQLDHMPLNKNGKINHRELPKPNVTLTSENYTSPNTATEIALVQIVAEVLQLNSENISVLANFFDLGGHSLKAIALANRVEERCGVTLRYAEVFTSEHLRSLASRIDSAEKGTGITIPIAPEQGPYTASALQKQLFALYELMPESTVYNMPGAVQLPNSVTYEQVKAAMGALIARHESLRTTFYSENEEVYQRINEEQQVEVAVIANPSEEDWKGFVTPFDLVHGPLWRMSFVHRDERAAELWVDFHHSIIDGVSQRIIQGELQELLAGASLAPVALQYKDYSSWFALQLAGDYGKKLKNYWTERFAQEVPELQLPYKGRKQAGQTFEGKSIAFKIGAEQTQFLKDLSAAHHGSLFTSVLACWSLLLTKLGATNDLVIGVPMAGRKHAQVKKMVGMFVNTLPIRLQWEVEEDFGTFLTRTQKQVVADIEKQEYPVQQLLDSLHEQQILSENTLYKTLFSWITAEDFSTEIEELSPAAAAETLVVTPKDTGVKFDLNVKFLLLEDEIVADLEFKSALFTERTAKNIVQRFYQLLTVLQSTPNTLISDIDVLLPHERKELLTEVNQTSVLHRDKGATLDQLFSKSAARNPSNIGLVDPKRSWTLAEIETKANALAGHLLACGAGGSLIGIYMEPCAEVFIAVLAAFKVRGAYLPLDVDTPKARIEYTLENSGAEVVLTQSDRRGELSFSGTVVCLDDTSWQTENPVSVSLNTPDSLAYMIYTSGSTGTPKGVRIQQKQLLNYVNWFSHNYEYGSDDKAVLLSSFAFDLGHSAVFPTLANGGTLHVLPREQYLNTSYLSRYLAANAITFIKTTPSFYALCLNDAEFELESLATLRYLMLGGEAIVARDLTSFFEKFPTKKLINHYGPTETTIGCIVKEFTAATYRELEEQVIIGTPIDNMKAYVLDTNLQPVAPGVKGQLYLAGAGLSQGYHGLPDSTDEKFIDNPWQPGTKMYATGDVVCWSEKSELLFKGRIDDQVKLNGYRIELDEVKRALIALDGVHQCAVLMTDTKGTPELVAFLELTNAKSIPEVARELSEQVPHYMIPKRLVEVKEIPVTANGKLNKKKLLASLSQADASEDVFAKNETERRLLALWNQALNTEEIAVNTNFFHLGGHSIKALKLINLIESTFGKKLALKTVFTKPTVQLLARELEACSTELKTVIAPAPQQESYPLSHAQKRLWMLHELSNSKSAYNVPKVFWLHGKVDVLALRQAFEGIIEKYEILRTVFRVAQGSPRQVILEAERFKQFIEVAPLPVKLDQVASFVSEKVNRVFDLAKGPLFDFGLYTTPEKTLLVMNLHHSISDGWSATILLNELCERYNALTTGKKYTETPLQLQFKDIASWELNQFHEGNFQAHQAFWNSYLSGERSRFSLPRSTSKTMTSKSEGATFSYVLEASLTSELNELAKTTASSVFMVLLAAFKATAYRYTEQRDLIVGSVVAGRNRQEYEDQLGFFVNTVVHRTQVAPQQSFEALLRSVRENVLQIAEYQDYPFDLLARDFEEGIQGTTPFFDVMFIHQNEREIQDDDLQLTDIVVEGVTEELQESKFDASFVTRETPEGLRVFVEYDKQCYGAGFIEQFVKHYEKVLQQVVSNVSIAVQDLQLLTPDEKALLNSFNETTQEKIYTSIHQRIEEKVTETPDATGLIFENRSYSYYELNLKANALACWIEDNFEHRRDRIIGISMRRSEWQVVCMLAILKSGAAFLPVDAKQPLQRKELIFKDANPLFVIADDSLDLTLENSEIVGVERLANYCEEYKGCVPTTQVQPDDLAYVIYTSGSTGVPKGVMIEHRGNINMVTDQIEQLGIEATDTCLQFASCSFDASVYEICIALYAGSTLVLVSDETIANPVKFSSFLQEANISFATLPPAYLSNLDRGTVAGIRVLVTAGEAPNKSDAAFYAKKLNYFNAYGPTEYSVCATLYKIDGSETEIPIGKPLENTQIQILDAQQRQVPIGVWGELYLSGAGMARGYINRPQKNAESFVQLPEINQERWYKTGDIGRWNADGNIEFKARVGTTIKIRGNRVDKGEVSAVCLQQPGVVEVALDFNPELQLLTAFMVTETPLDQSDLKRDLRKQLPEYMIPGVIVFMEQIPLTTNGKVAYAELRKELATQDLSGLSSRVAPSSETEEKLLSIWSKLLKRNSISVSTDVSFFELGGHSIALMAMISQVWEEFHKELRVRDFFMNPTIQGIADILDKQSTTETLLVPLNQTDSASQMFMIPPVLGSSVMYKELAEALGNAGVACYGLQYPGIDFDTPLPVSMSDMVERMWREIAPLMRSAKRKYLLGYSMGALLAAELTKCAKQEGIDVALILIDKDPQIAFSELAHDGEHQIDDALIEELITEQLQGNTLPEHSKARVERVVANNVKILQSYCLTMEAVVTNVLAIGAEDSGQPNKMNAWKAFSSDKFSTQIIPGNHFSIWQEANKRTLYNAVINFTNHNSNQKL